MPLVRCEVRNEYGLGLPELYKEANIEDPKAVLDGVAVSGLVGILRQLGDLAEFAAEVFHGLQEQVMITASRSHKLMVRVQDIEAALPPLEKAVLAQTSHLHFCYTAGSEWHPRIRNESNHFIYNDLPRFIMDSYEECRDPPRLHLLDKFDPGGPGSCLKKYSDPTFFKRVSAISNEANAERRRDKKARKSKKKRSWQKNGEVSRSASILNGSGRMQFASPHDYEQASPAQTVSYTDTTFKSDLGDQSHSFDSRAGSGYIECVFHLSSPMQLDKQDPKESSSSRLNLQNHDNFDSSFLDHTRVEEDDDDFSRSSLQEQAAPNPSCVTWDEKTEIVEPEGQHCDSDEAPDILPTASCQNMPELAVNTRNVERVDVSTDFANEQSIPGGSQPDDIESEADNYMDALNTIESESESDFDCQTKREVEPSNFNNSEIESGIHSSNFESHTASVSSLSKELSRDLLDTVSSENFNNSEIESGIHPFNFESHTASVSSLNKELSRDLLDTVSLERFAHEDSPQIAGVAFEQDSLPGHDFSESNNTLDGSKSEAVTSDLSSSRSMIPDQQDPESDKVIKSVGETQESAAEFPGVPSVQFWTNGGLLGLEPSKPPDCRVSNAASQNSVSESKNITSPSGHTAAIKDGVSSGQLDVLVNNSQSIEKSPKLNCSIPCHDNQEDATYIMKKSWGKSSANLGIKHETSGDSHHINRFDHIQGFGLDGASLLTPKTDLPISPDFNVASTDTNQENDRMFGLGHRLLVNGFRRKPSLMHADKFETANSLKSGAFEHKSGRHTVSNNSLPEITFKEQFRNGSSPPLEHMKISFEPMNSFETSKLKLKFPDGRHIQEFNGDMFPSFQLVPEPALPLHEIGSDSDDDTFCRSSSSMSDDCLSHHSQSNSEQWESSETLGSKDHELYGTLCRISSMESISNSLELEGKLHGSFRIDSSFKSPYAENIMEPNHCGPLFDLPSFDAVKPSLQQEITFNSDPHDSLLSNCPKEPTPPPPPLPPVQWRILKSHSDITEDEQNFASEGLSHAFDMKDLQSAVPLEQPNSASIKHQQIIAEASLFTPKSKQQDQQKLNGQKAADQDANGKGLDEKDDFLQQIRTKSFNLRRTYTAKPTYSAAPATNVKVTAILEKAIAIRQAVGSDDGEDDDTWSDA